MENCNGIQILPSEVGKVFGKLKVVGAPFRVRKSQTRVDWLVVVQCHCGTYKCCFWDNVRGGKTTSCGCYRDLRVRESVGKHLRAKTSLHNIWLAMKSRCYNPNNKSYHNYGGRGVRVCERWLGEDGFSNFLSDMQDRPSNRHSLDRIDNNGDYCPENCRWATKIEQSLNKRCSIVLTIDGVTKHYTEWADQYGLARTTVLKRIRKGKIGEECLKPSRNKNRPYKAN
jgi:hypothetical protein